MAEEGYDDLQVTSAYFYKTKVMKLFNFIGKDEKNYSIFEMHILPSAIFSAVQSLKQN